MYVPSLFAETDISVAHDLIEANSFGLLVVSTASGPSANHLPFLLDRNAGRHGTLQAHVARGNPVWRDIEASPDVLSVFQGPHGYISPDWYEGADLLPTWNYAAVHVRGVARLLDEAETRDHLRRLAEANESGLPDKAPWAVDSLPEALFSRALNGLVGLSIAITGIEAKFKMGQNRGPADVKAAAAALRASGRAEDRLLAEEMERRLPPED